MKEKKYLIGVDGGTTGAKAGVYDFKGKLIGIGHVESDSIYPQSGWVENDPEVVKNQAFESCRLAIENAGIDPEEIAAIALSSPSPVLVFLDDNLNPMRNIIGWQDMRGLPYALEERKKPYCNAWCQKSGVSLLSSLSVMGKIMWVRDNQPEVLEKVKIITDSQGYLLHCFGAKRIAIDIGSAGRCQIIDIRERAKSQELVEMAGITIEQFPELVQSGIPMGTVSEEAAHLSGLVAGVPLIMGAHDQVCNQIGIGALYDGDNCVNSGTFGNCAIVTDSLPEDIGEPFFYKCNTAMNNWTVEGLAIGSAVNFKWFRDTFGTMEKSVAKEIGKDVYDLLAAEAALSQPGANGITYMPHVNGCRMGSYPNVTAKATFTGMNLMTVRADMVRAVMEGICYDLYDLAVQQQVRGCKLTKIRLSGGVTRSPFWCQMFADIFNKPVEVTATEETGTLGAAMLAGMGAGVYKNISDAVDQCVHVEKQYIPNPAVKEAYEHAFDCFLDVEKRMNA